VDGVLRSVELSCGIDCRDEFLNGYGNVEHGFGSVKGRRYSGKIGVGLRNCVDDGR
jgi:hypothetical protein